MQITTVPAHLWIGAHHVVKDAIIAFLQKSLCTHNGCNVCITCMQIKTEQSKHATWIMPDKRYVIATLEPIFNIIHFALEENEQHFFILQHADQLSPICANKLLKVMEEPPPGYYFILSAASKETILPTIQSRCAHRFFTDKDHDTMHPQLFSCMTGTTHIYPAEFLKLVDQSKITEQETKQLLDNILHYWVSKQTDALTRNDTNDIKHTQQMTKQYATAFKYLPMPGSAKLFWKNLYLSLHT